MSTRYLTNVAVMIAAGFLVVATMAFAATTAAWLTFGVAAGLTLVSLYMVVERGAIPQRIVGGIGLILGAWTVAASLVFAPTTVVWLGFASAIAFAALGLVGLTIHELTNEQVVHKLELSGEAPAVRQPHPNGQAVAA